MDVLPRQPLRSEKLFTPPFFTVINRTCRVLTVTVDGVAFVMQPGENPGISWAVAQYATKQHPRKGTFERTIQVGESLLAVKGITDPRLSTLIPPGQEALGDELIDRRAFPHKHAVQLEELPASYRIAQEDLEDGDPMQLPTLVSVGGNKGDLGGVD